MDFSMLTEYFVLVVILACLVIGYVIKHASFMTWMPNNDIPVVLAVVGALANLWESGLSFESAVYGALMGLASTGLYEAFRKWIDNSNE